MKPIIGVTMTTSNGQYCINEAYVKAIIQAGGIPVNIPFGVESDAEQLLDGIDGLLLTGGVDVHPHFFDEEPHIKIGDIMIERDEVELVLTEAALKKNDAHLWNLPWNSAFERGFRWNTLSGYQLPI